MFWSRDRARHHRADERPRRSPGAVFRAFREATRLDDWRQVYLLRVVTAAILATVSFYYLWQWARFIGMPPIIAWTPPAALDVTAYMSVKVALHPRSRAAKRKASALAWLCVALSLSFQVGSHAFELHILTHPEFWMLAVTAALYPFMLVAGHVVAVGMEPRPQTVAQQAAAEAERVRAEAEIAALRDEARLAQATRRRAIHEAAPAPSARVTERATPAERPGDVPVERPPAPASSPAGDTPGDTAGDGADQRVSEAHLFELSVAYLLDNPDAGRRVLLTHLREVTGLGKGITEYMLKGRPGSPGIHQRAQDEASARAAAAEAAVDEAADEVDEEETALAVA